MTIRGTGLWTREVILRERHCGELHHGDQLLVRTENPLQAEAECLRLKNLMVCVQLYVDFVEGHIEVDAHELLRLSKEALKL